MFYALAQQIAVAGSRIPMALDFIGVGGRGGEEVADLLLRLNWPRRVLLSQSAL